MSEDVLGEWCTKDKENDLAVICTHKCPECGDDKCKKCALKCWAKVADGKVDKMDKWDQNNCPGFSPQSSLELEAEGVEAFVEQEGNAVIAAVKSIAKVPDASADPAALVEIEVLSAQRLASHADPRPHARAKAASHEHAHGLAEVRPAASSLAQAQNVSKITNVAPRAGGRQPSEVEASAAARAEIGQDQAPTRSVVDSKGEIVVDP